MAPPPLGYPGGRHAGRYMYDWPSVAHGRLVLGLSYSGGTERPSVYRAGLPGPLVGSAIEADHLPQSGGGDSPKATDADSGNLSPPNGLIGSRTANAEEAGSLLDCHGGLLLGLRYGSLRHGVTPSRRAGRCRPMWAGGGPSGAWPMGRAARRRPRSGDQAERCSTPGRGPPRLLLYLRRAPDGFSRPASVAGGRGLPSLLLVEGDGAAVEQEGVTGASPSTPSNFLILPPQVKPSRPVGRRH